MNKYIYAILAVILFVTMPAYGFHVEMTNKTIPVSIGDIQSIDIRISSERSDFFVFSLSGMRSWITIPASIPVLPGESSTAKIYFSPYNSTPPIKYNMKLGIESVKTGEKIYRNMTVDVKSTNVMVEKVNTRYQPKINETNLLQVFVKNYESNDVDVDVQISIIDSDGNIVNEFKEPLELSEKEIKLFEKEFVLPDCSPAGKYTIKTVVSDKNNVLSESEYEFQLNSQFLTDMKRVEKRGLLGTEVFLTVKNIGNKQGIAEVNDRVWGSLFFSGESPDNTSGDTFIWKKSLDVCETKIIKYSIDYSLLVFIIIIILLLVYLFYRMRTVTIKKFIISRDYIKKGEKITIGLDVKTHMKVNDVEIKDFVPSVFKVVDAKGMKPTKKKIKFGTELVWKLHQLQRGEERIVHYKIEPLFSVTGTVKLPKAILLFKYLGKSLKKRSNLIDIGADVIDEYYENRHIKKIKHHIGKLKKHIKRKK